MTSESIRLQFTDKELQFNAENFEKSSIDSSMKIICSKNFFFAELAEHEEHKNNNESSLLQRWGE